MTFERDAGSTRPSRMRQASVIRWIRAHLRYSGLLVAIAVLAAVFTLLTPPGTFLSPLNALGLLRSMATLSILALAATLVIVLGEIDLSFGYVYGLCGMVMGVAWLSWGWPLPAAIVAAFATGAAVGIFNGILTTRIGIPSFIVTLGSGALAFGLTLLVSNSRSYNYHAAVPGRQLVGPEVELFGVLGGAQLPFAFPAQGVWMITIAVAMFFVLDRSLFGFRLKAIGGNNAAAFVARLPVLRYKVAAFVTMSVAACLASLLDFSFIGSVQPDSGTTLVFPVFSAVIIGGASLAGGSGSTIGTMSGALLLAVMTNGFAVLAVGAWAQQMLIGGITILAVVLDRVTSRRSS